MNGTSTEDTFFDRKRPWSAIKDQVLGGYIPAFVAKVKQLQRPILLIDAFAGPGVFSDGSSGSPLLLCKAASSVKAQWRCVFINQNKAHHQKLTAVLEKARWGDNSATVLGDASDYLRKLCQTLTGESLFLYLDPFGLKGCDFDIVKAYVERAAHGHVVEVIVNLSIPTLHRLAASQAVAEGRKDEAQIVKLNEILTRALGGCWWQPIMWSKVAPREKEERVIKQYIARLAEWLPYVGYCPVRERHAASVKYYVTYGTGHPDGLVLMNDRMLRAYGSYIFNPQAANQQSFWDWEEGRDLSGLRSAVLDAVRRAPYSTREQIWLLIIRDHFMKWQKKEFHSTLIELANEGLVNYPPDPSTGRRNKNSLLSLV